MKIAIPVENGMLSEHFGHAQQFAFIEADSQTGDIKGAERRTPPEHQSGVIPRWLMDQKVDCVIARGLGKKAAVVLSAQDIEVIVGAPALSPEELVQLYLDNRLLCNQNTCDRSEKKQHCSHEES